MAVMAIFFCSAAELPGRGRFGRCRPVVRRRAGGEDGGGNDAEYGAGVCGARGHGRFSFAERVKL